MNGKRQSIDLVIAIFNEEKNIVSLVNYISSVLSSRFSKINFILVDDGSTDNTQKEVQKLKHKNSNIRVKYIRLTKNFGKDLALKCGLDHSTATICVMIDGDFQHPPEKILEAYDKILQGYNIVHIIKNEYKNGPKYRKLGSSIFKSMINFLSENPIHLTDYKVMDLRAVKVLKKYKESSYFSCGIIDMIGLRSVVLKYVPEKRRHGKSNFSLQKLLRLAIANIISISIKPLRISIYSGIIISFLSIVYGLFIVFEKIFLSQPIPGFATLAAALFFLGGLQLLFLGILGEYVGKTFIESKRRPQYIIDYIADIK
ncbi:MAG: glycosyltransferase family 2 protein [Candidatus Hodarchaeota archaeon]